MSGDTQGPAVVPYYQALSPTQLGAVLLHLEYTCTSAERTEAESLLLRQSVARGSMWGTLIVLLIILAAMLSGMWWMMVRSIPPPYRPWAVGGFVALFAFAFRHQRRLRKQQSGTMTLEFCEGGLRILSGNSHLALGWESVSKMIESEKLILLKTPGSAMAAVVPRRVLPSDQWVTWLRGVTSGASLPPPASAVSVPTEPAAVVEIIVVVRLRFRDFLHLMAHSWVGRGAMLAWIALNIGVGINAALHPLPNPKRTPAEMLIYFMIPMMFVGAGFMLLMMAGNSWMRNRRGEHKVKIREDSLTIQMPNDTEAVVPLTTYRWFKETRQSFIVWARGNGNWLLLPKRAFDSAEEVQRCRGIMQGKLRPSGWLWAS